VSKEIPGVAPVERCPYVDCEKGVLSYVDSVSECAYHFDFDSNYTTQTHKCGTCSRIVTRSYRWEPQEKNDE